MSVRRISVSSDKSSASAVHVAESPQPKLKVKVVYENDIRLHKISPNDIEAAWNSVHVFSSSIFKIPRSSMLVQFIDDEGDKVTITTATDLQEAVDWSLQEGKTLKLYVVVSSAPVVVPQSATIPASAVLAAVAASRSVQNDPTRLQQAQYTLGGAGSRPSRPASAAHDDIFALMATDPAFQQEAVDCMQEIVAKSQRGRNLSDAVAEALRSRPRVRGHPQVHEFLSILPGVKDEIQPAISSIDPNNVPELVSQVINTTKSVGSSIFSLFATEEKKPEPPPQTDLTIESLKLLGAIARPIVMASLGAAGSVAKTTATHVGRAAVSAASNMLSSAAAALDGDNSTTPQGPTPGYHPPHGCDHCAEHAHGHGHGHRHQTPHHPPPRGLGHGHPVGHAPGHGYYQHPPAPPQHAQYSQYGYGSNMSAFSAPQLQSVSLPSMPDRNTVMSQISRVSSATNDLMQMAGDEYRNYVREEMSARPRAQSASAAQIQQGVQTFTTAPPRRRSLVDTPTVSSNVQQPAQSASVAAPKPKRVVPYKAEVVDENCTRGFSAEMGAPFTKQWVIKNSGDVTWPEGVLLAHAAGRRPDPLVGSVTEVELPAVGPGEQISVELEFVAPMSRGIFSSPWKLSTADGANFGPVFRARVTVK